MGFKSRAATANCGNDGIGKQAASAIHQLMVDEDLDFFVLNCQEADFKKTQDQLLKEGYTLVQSTPMPTHTKPKAWWPNVDYGMVTFIICKAGVTATASPSKLVRRSDSGWGSAYNKGGLITDFVISKKGESNLKVQTVSGHLESNDAENRSLDWAKINNGLAQKVDDWDALVKGIPHLAYSGYDANTRDVIQADGSVNLWQKAPNDPSIQVLNQAPLGMRRYTGEDTYKTHTDKTHAARNSRRSGYANKGSLDFVAVFDGQGSESGVFVGTEGEGTKGRRQISSTKGEGRDHDVIVSPLNEYDPNLSDFDRVRRYVATRLMGIAPDLAKEILDGSFADNEANRNTLVRMHEVFLSPEGLLAKGMEVHIKKLECLDGLNSGSVIKTPESMEYIRDALCPQKPWFAEFTIEDFKDDKSYNAKQRKYGRKIEATTQMLVELEKCTAESEILNWVSLGSEYWGQCKDNDTIADEISFLKGKFDSKCKEFEAILNTYRLPQSTDKSKQLLILSGFLVMAQLKSEWNERDINDPTAASYNKQLLIRYCTVLDQSTKAVNAVAEQRGKGLDKANNSCEQLRLLSSRVSGKESKSSKSFYDKVSLFILGVALVAFTIALVLFPICAPIALLGIKVVTACIVLLLFKMKVIDKDNTSVMEQDLLNYKDAVEGSTKTIDERDEPDERDEVPTHQ
ncbi:MAG: hypothetical protein ACHP6H_01675 [Legionellales bacterium]